MVAIKGIVPVLLRIRDDRIVFKGRKRKGCRNTSSTNKKCAKIQYIINKYTTHVRELYQIRLCNRENDRRFNF